MGKHVIYTDGGSHNNGKYKGIGSWAYVQLSANAVDAEIISSGMGYGFDTTNNRMEMMAVINAISQFPLGTKVQVFSDSGYVVTGFNNPSYLKKWRTNGWRNSKKKPVENRDLWEHMIQLDELYDMQLVLVKGHQPKRLHDTDPRAKWNNWCDNKCSEQLEIAKSIVDNGGI